mgnify:CR=1 FL=1
MSNSFSLYKVVGKMYVDCEKTSLGEIVMGNLTSKKQVGFMFLEFMKSTLSLDKE